MPGYTPLFNSIVTSSVWNEDNETRIVWITMLALMDSTGKVEGSEAGLAPVARVSLESCVKAIAKLKSPDPYSRTKEHEGRRIIEIDGGWQIINYQKFRDKAKSRAEYYRQWRQKQNPTSLNNSNPNKNTDSNSNSETAHNSATVAQQNVTEQNKPKKKSAYTDDFVKFWNSYPRKEGKGKAWEAWQKHKPPIAQVLTTLERYKRSASWLPDEKGKTYIPHPATWINGGRWEDEVAVQSEPPVVDKDGKTQKQRMLDGIIR